MSIRDERRRGALERMADHLLREGMAGASLRPLAAAAGTSDRMLLYYFTNRDELLAATLEHLAARLAGLLDEAGQSAVPRPFATLLAEVWAAVRAPALRPYMYLWLDLAAAAARGQEPYRAVAGQIADEFLTWAATRLQVTREADRKPQAALLLAAVDGLVLLDAAGRSPAADEAAGAIIDFAGHVRA